MSKAKLIVILFLFQKNFKIFLKFVTKLINHDETDKRNQKYFELKPNFVIKYKYINFLLNFRNEPMIYSLINFFWEKSLKKIPENLYFPLFSRTSEMKNEK